MSKTLYCIRHGFAIHNKLYHLIYVLFFLAAVFFILSLSIKLNEVLKIILFPFTLTKKILDFFKKDKEKLHINDEKISNIETEIENLNEQYYKKKQPILPFSKKRETVIQKNIFKLPLIDFLKKNTELKSKKIIDDLELKKN